jgi:cobalt-zinc-cadmium efflux system outer membrane protein
MKRIICLSVMVWLFTVTATTAQEALDDYLVLAARNNPGLKARFNDYLSSLERVPQVGALPDPQVIFGYFIMPVETRVGPQRFRISASQMFPWFGTLGARKDAAAAMAQAQYETFEDARAELFFNVKSTYYNLYFVTRAATITADNIDLLHTLRALALTRTQAGMTSSADVLRLEMETADMENQLALLQDNITTLTATFAHLLNADTLEAVMLPDTLWSDTLAMTKEQIMDSINIQNHQIRQLDNMVASYQDQQKVAEKMGYPNLSLGLDYINVGKSSLPAAGTKSGNDALVFPSVGITIPLYRKKYEAMVKETVLMQEATTDRRVDKYNTLLTVFERTMRDYKDAERRVTLYRSQLVLARQSLNIMEAAYSTDTKMFQDLLEVERQMLKYALELEKARADGNAAVAFLNYLMGQ